MFRELNEKVQNPKAAGYNRWSYNTEGGDIMSVYISADGQYFAAGGADNKVYVFNRVSSTPLWSFRTGNDINSVMFSADGCYIVAGSDDNKVYLFMTDESAYDDGNGEHTENEENGISDGEKGIPSYPFILFIPVIVIALVGMGVKLLKKLNFK